MHRPGRRWNGVLAERKFVLKLGCTSISSTIYRPRRANHRLRKVHSRTPLDHTFSPTSNMRLQVLVPTDWRFAGISSITGVTHAAVQFDRAPGRKWDRISTCGSACLERGHVGNGDASEVGTMIVTLASCFNTYSTSSGCQLEKWV